MKTHTKRYASLNLNVEYADVDAFLLVLAQLYGTKRTAMVRFIRSTQAFQDWRAKVEYCAVCQHFVVLEKDPANRPNGKRFEAHKRCRDGAAGPIAEECQGSCRSTVWSGDRDPHPPTIVRAHIEHIIRSLQPGLL